MPYFRDHWSDIGTDNLTLTPEPIKGFVVNFGTVGLYTYLEMSTGLIYSRLKDCGLKTHAGWLYLHETCIYESFRPDMPYTMFDLECMNLIKLQSVEPYPDVKAFKEAYKNIFVKYGVPMLHHEYFTNGTKESPDV
jgi:hypothetical protein